jgi:hypothetical protein
MEEFHWFYGQTVVNPLGLAMVVIMCIFTLFLPRRYALWPLAFIACFVAPAQRFYVLLFNFTFLRIMIMCVWLRLIMYQEVQFKMTTIDRLVIAWAFVHGLAYALCNGFALEAIVFASGEAFDALGLYFLFRCLIRDWNDWRSNVFIYMIISIPVAFFFFIEHSSGHNPFAFLGGVPEITFVREGRLRCQGAFPHPILAGSFWASLLPLIVAEWWNSPIRRWLVVITSVCVVLIVVMCASSGPLSALLLGAGAALIFPLRRRMRMMRWGIVVGLIGLQFVMRSPIWHVLAYLDLAGGSTSWYRFYLIDQTVAHFGDWWAFGVTSTASWGNDNQSLEDITNQYVLEAIRGGIVTLGLFVAIIAVGFRDVGRLWRACGKDKARTVMAWALGISLFINMASFVSVAYTGQVVVVWYFLLAGIASLMIRQSAEVGARHVPPGRARGVGRQTQIPHSMQRPKKWLIPQ